MIYSRLVKALFQMVYGPLPDPPADGEGRGLVLVADGVGGLDLCGTGLRYVMGSMKEPHLVRVFPWGHGLGKWHADLTNVSNRDAQAEKVAGEVQQFLSQNPAEPVFLIGKSGGTGIIVKALERLPENTVAGVVLIAPALSASYDLSRALRAVRHEVVVFWSPLDLIVLGAGTRIFGTIDRVKAVSAGLTGFRVPAGLDDAQKVQYGKLRQVRWHARMAPTGNLGGHVGPDTPAFLRKYVVPLLRLPDEALAAKSDRGQDGPAPGR